MGRITEIGNGEQHDLRGIFSIGRASGCDLTLAAPEVSANHAVLRFEGDVWHVRDLGSTNGTRVDGRAIPSGVLVPLAVGARLSFGVPEPKFILASAEAPVPFVRSLTGETIRGESTRLVLPGGAVVEQALATGAWVWRGAHGGVEVYDGQEIEIGGRRWRVYLPTHTPRTARGVHLADLTARFDVSADEEFVRLSLVHSRGCIELPPRTYHYHLLVLARARRDDTAASEPERGWTDVDGLCRALACTANQLRVYLHRARQQLANAYVVGAEDLIERRPTTGAIRFGIAHIEERRL